MIGGLFRLYWDGGAKQSAGAAGKSSAKRRRPVSVVSARNAVDELAELLRAVESSPASPEAARLIAAPVARPQSVEWRAEPIEQINAARAEARKWLGELAARIEREQAAESAAAVAAVAARVRELLHLADQAATDLDLIFVAHLMAEM